MRNILAALIFLAGAAAIGYRVYQKKLPRVCLAYAAGIAIISACTIITGRTLNIIAVTPLFVLTSVAQRRMQSGTHEKAQADTRR